MASEQVFSSTSEKTLLYDNDEIGFVPESPTPIWARFKLITLRLWLAAYFGSASNDSAQDDAIDALVIKTDALEADLATETSERIDADAILTADLATETSERIDADAILTADLVNETSERIDADAILTADLAAETSARINADLLTNARIISQSSLSVIGQGGTLPTTETPILLNAGLTGGAGEITVDTVNSYINFNNGSDAIIKIAGFATHTNPANTILTINVYNAITNALIGTDTFTLIGDNKATVPFNFHFKVNALDHSSIRLTKMANQANTTNFSTALTAEAQGTSGNDFLATFPWLAPRPAGWDSALIEDDNSVLLHADNANLETLRDYSSMSLRSHYFTLETIATATGTGQIISNVLFITNCPLNTWFYLDVIININNTASNANAAIASAYLTSEAIANNTLLYRIDEMVHDNANTNINSRVRIPNHIQGWVYLTETTYTDPNNTVTTFLDGQIRN